MTDASRVTTAEALSTLLDDVARRVAVETRTFVPATVVRFARTPRAEVSVRVDMLARLRTGELVSVPQVDRVPVLWPAGGGWTHDADLAEGDQVGLLVFDRDISNWLAAGGEAAPLTASLHSVSSSACMAVSLRSDDAVASAAPGPGTYYLGTESGAAPWMRLAKTPASVTLEAPAISLGQGATSGVARLGEPVMTGIVPAALPAIVPNPTDPWFIWFTALTGVANGILGPGVVVLPTTPIGWVSTASTAVKSV